MSVDAEARRRHPYEAIGALSAMDKAASVDAAQPDEARGVLERVRAIIRKAVPGADEVISYQMPAYKLHGSIVIYFAAWKHHVALYPADAQVFKVFKKDLAPYEVSKGTIRFPLSQPVPVKLIEAIAKFRAREVAERKTAVAKMSASPKRKR